jgi:hypothetical protein
MYFLKTETMYTFIPNYKMTFSRVFIMIVGFFAITSCSEDVPEKEDVPELITKATLTFTPQGGGDAVIVSATDPDGDGVQPITVDGEINLATDKTYVLTVLLSNTLVAPTDPAYDITAEVEAEGDEHMFFFGWTGDVFSNPSGDGNIDSRAGVVNYTGGENSLDENELPLGLTTTWTTSASSAEGKFEIRLKHQPGLKTDTSGSDAGETDLSLTFDIFVQ